jgi:transcription factor TGA
MFDMEYARWLEDDSKYMTELQGILQAQNIDANLGAIVEECMQHYEELFHLRAMLARSDVFHLMTGLWATTAERCFLWMGGFRPSEILKVFNAKCTPLFFLREKCQLLLKPPAHFIGVMLIAEVSSPWFVIRC